jgi:hypothetical protein
VEELGEVDDKEINPMGEKRREEYADPDKVQLGMNLKIVENMSRVVVAAENNDILDLIGGINDPIYVSRRAIIRKPINELEI